MVNLNWNENNNHQLRNRCDAVKPHSKKPIKNTNDIELFGILSLMKKKVLHDFRQPD